MPLPPNAKSVFKGVIFEIFQWEQTMFDGTVETFERAVRPNTTETIAVLDGKIVVLEQSQPHEEQPFLSFAGGRIEAGEEPLESAKRELLEETGLVSDDWHLYAERHQTGKVLMSNWVYIARDCRAGAPQHLDAGERITLAPRTFEETLALADDPRFFHTGFKNDLIRAKYDPAAREAFRKAVFG